MKIFIAGARSIKYLDEAVKQQIIAMSRKGYEFLIGDCYGVDSSVQAILNSLSYKRIEIYASDGKARNNIGHWNVKTIAVQQNMHGFDFYKQKDIAMAKDADYGFMIWDGKSKGTLNNMVNLLSRDKSVLVYLNSSKRFFYIKSLNGLTQFVRLHSQNAYETYTRLTENLLSSSGA